MRFPTRDPMGQTGGSLIQVMIASAILLAITLATTSLVLSIMKRQRVIEQKAEIADLDQAIGLMMKDSGSCKCNFNPAVNTEPGASLIIDTTASGPTLKPVVLKAGCGAGSPTLAKEGERLPGSQTGIVVQDIRVTEIQPTGQPNEYQGFLEIRMDPGTLEMALKPVRRYQKFLLNPSLPATATSVDTCAGEGTFWSVFFSQTGDTPATFNPGDVFEGRYSLGYPDAGWLRIANSQGNVYCAITAIDDDTSNVHDSAPEVPGSINNRKIDNTLGAQYGITAKCTLIRAADGYWYAGAPLSSGLVWCGATCWKGL